MSLGPNFIGTLPSSEEGAFITVAHLTAKGEPELKTLLSILHNVHKSATSDAEPDCIGYEAIQAHDDPLSIIVYGKFLVNLNHKFHSTEMLQLLISDCTEKYRSSEALEFHRTTEAFQAFAKQAKDLTSLRHIRFYKPLTP
ncbi:uncharacterized protein FA14DRAFT_22510 [Meira miltonrushii]|uniref:ABM domain-containing protein n=1 Tax=Meira miltonrushii TaxID=1280837 RepID=A0A316VKC6_9BASI|nr:uncharacterized protein FA14DRAFT_22510 [Meira miltonrushii]PWN38052.1 hypothetical protein FA14DRAFT_22510 [Meira miltonrushii]